MSARNDRARIALLSLLLGVLLVAHLYGVRQVWEQVLSGGADFTAFYAAGRVVDEGRGAQVYRYETQREFQKEFPWRKEPLLFYHPPYEALLFVPLARLSFSAAFLAWFAVNLTLAGACALVKHPEESRSLPGVLIHAIGILLFYPVMVCLWQGQDSLLLLLLISLGYVALRKGWELRGGCLFGLALFKFQFVLPLLFVLTLKRRVRVLAGVLAAGAALTLVSLLLVGWEGVVGYPRFLLETSSNLARGTIHPENMPNLRGFFALWSPGNSPAALVLTAVVSVGVLMVGTRFWRVNDGSADAFDLGVAFNVVLAVLVSYHLNTHDLTLLLLPVWLLVRHLRATRGQMRLSRRFLAVLLAALFVPPFLFPAGFLPPGTPFWVMTLLAATISLEIRAYGATAGSAVR